MTKLKRYPALGLALALATGPALAAVQVAPTGFLVRQEATIAAAPARVYEALVGRVGSWWNAQHTYSGDSANLSIDARPGGCFCERLANGGGIEHMRVVYVAPPATLRMTGALGPLQQSGVSGALTWKLSPDGAGTKLELTYSVGGFIDGGFEKMGPAVDGVLAEQLRRLRLLVETGSPVLK